MSAFRDLLKQAHEKGVAYMRFEVDLAQFFADEQAPSWAASKITWHDLDDVPGDRGRTGEEALRVLVEGLK